MSLLTQAHPYQVSHALPSRNSTTRPCVASSAKECPSSTRSGPLKKAAFLDSHSSILLAAWPASSSLAAFLWILASVRLLKPSQQPHQMSHALPSNLTHRATMRVLFCKALPLKHTKRAPLSSMAFGLLVSRHFLRRHRLLQWKL